MKQFFSKNRRWIGYALYGVLLTLAFLYFLFPSDSIRDYVRASVHNMNPNLTVTFKKVSPAFSLGLKFTQVECTLEYSPEQNPFKAKNILVRPKIFSLFGKDPEYRFICQAYNGIITGRINLQSGQRGILNISTEFDNIHIDDSSPLPVFIADYMNGVLEGTVTYRGDKLYDTNGTGDAFLRLSNGSFDFGSFDFGSFEIMQPIFNMNVIYYKELLIKADLKGLILNISDINLEGDDFLAQASGAIGLKDPIEKSSLNLKCTIEPTASFFQDAGDAALLIREALKNGKISFSIQGTIEKWNIKLI